MWEEKRKLHVHAPKITKSGDDKIINTIGKLNCLGIKPAPYRSTLAMSYWAAGNTTISVAVDLINRLGLSLVS